MLRDGLVKRILTESGDVADLDAAPGIEWPEELAFGDFDGAEEGETNKELLETTIKLFASKAYRTILTCYRDMSMADFEALADADTGYTSPEVHAAIESELTAISIFGLEDPLKPGIFEAIKGCQTAGIRVIMCTGDNIDTATAISLNAGIVAKEDVRTKYTCMTGEDFRSEVGGLRTEYGADGAATGEAVGDRRAFRKIYPHLAVLARCSPEDKYLLVTGIQGEDQVVAVTGDGTNDAPALTKADVGFAMGIAGTDVAKGASDIILMDDNFSSLVVALEYGRSVYDNVRKFLQFQLTVNVVAMFIVFLGAVILKDAPLNAVQMLWVNLIMDTFAALALATEPPEGNVLTRKPYAKSAAIVTDVMWRNVFGHAIYQSVVLIVLIFTCQDRLCKVYDVPCAGHMVGLGCDDQGFNPFATKGLYYHVGGHGTTDWPGPSAAEQDGEAFDARTWFEDKYPIRQSALAEWRCDTYRLYDEEAFHALFSAEEEFDCASTATQERVSSSDSYGAAGFDATYPYDW
jgi:hypothetical protein